MKGKPSPPTRVRCSDAIRQLGFLCVLFLAVSAEAQESTGREMGFEIVGRGFVALQVRDDSTAMAWYQGVLGLEQVNHLEAPDGRYSIRILAREGLTLELIRLRGAEQPPSSHLGFLKVGFYVDNIDRTFEWLRQSGVDTDESVFSDRAIQARSFTFRDPFGNRWQVFQACGAPCDP